MWLQLRDTTNMGAGARLYGILVTLLYVLIFVTGDEPLNNKCNFSHGHQILTCVNLNPKHSDLGNFIKADTQLLIIKRSSRLEIPANYHINKNFRRITSYQVVENGEIEINSFAFKNLESLQFLKISNNQHWAILQSNTFNGLNGLATLNIANNSIERLDNHAFDDLSSLEILELTYNKFRVVPSLIFKSLQHVMSLFLYENHIEVLENECFEGLIEIKILDITHNKLKAIKTTTFNSLTKLTDLYLSFNEIEAIEGEFTLPNLKFLYLQHNKLTSISNNVFNSAGNLKAVDLSYNEISFIADNTFYKLRSLDHVHFGHNNATSFANLNFNDVNKPLIVF